MEIGSSTIQHAHDGPHDNHILNAKTPEQRECIICMGQTTQVLDMAKLSEGFTFINKNLYPIFYPEGKDEKN